MKYIITITLLAYYSAIFSQSVGIGTTTPSSSAALDVSSTSKGFLMPRMTTIQRDAIVNPEVGLQIYNQDDKCTDTYNGQNWAKECGLQLINDDTVDITNFEQMLDFPSVRSGASGFSISGKGYLTSGFNGNNFQNDLWEYDTNIWTQKANYGGTQRTEAVGFAINSKGYVATGRVTTAYLNDIWEYNPISNLWVQKATSPMAGRSKATAFVIDNKAIIVGSHNNNNEVWEYDPSIDVWTQKQSIPGLGRAFPYSFSINGNGYVGGGSHFQNPNFITLNDFYQYNYGPGVMGGSWISKQNNISLAGSMSFSLGSRGYLAGGFQYNPQGIKIFQPWFLVYNPHTDNWLWPVNFPSDVATDGISFALGDIAFLGIGHKANGTHSQQFYKFTPNYNYEQGLPSTYNKINNAGWTQDGNQLYTTNPLSSVNISGQASISDANTFEFGKNVAGKEAAAGKIGYQTFSGNALDIVGAGTSYPSRNVKIYDRLYFENILANKKLVLWDQNSLGSHQFYGMGIESGTLRFQVAGAGNFFRFYAGSGISTSKKLVEFQEAGNHTFYGTNELKTFYIYNSGNVEVTNKIGINVSPDPNHFLKVFSGPTGTTGTYTSTGWLHSSDRNLKTNIHTLENSLDKIIKLRGVGFNWKTTPTKDHQIGFLAQEVEEVFPDAVLKNESGEYSIAVQNLVAPLVEAIKELKILLDQLNNKNEELQKRLQSLESKIR